MIIIITALIVYTVCIREKSPLIIESRAVPLNEKEQTQSKSKEDNS